MGAEGKITIKAVMDGLDKVKDDLSKLGQAGETVKDNFSGVGKSMTSAVFSGNLLYGAVMKIGSAIKDTVEEGISKYLEYEKTLTVLAFTTKQNAGELEGLTTAANEFSKTTIYSQDELLKAESFLSTQGRTEAQIKKVIEAATNLSTATGEDLQSSVRKLDATYEGSIGRLGRLDSSLKTLTKEQLANGDAVTMLNDKYKGLADQVGNTTAGQVDRLKNKWDEYKKGLGSSIVGLFETTNGVNVLTEAVGKNTDALNNQSIPAWKRLMALFSTSQNIENQTITSIQEYNKANEHQVDVLTSIIGKYGELFGKMNLINLANSMKGKSAVEIMNTFKEMYKEVSDKPFTINGTNLNINGIKTYKELTDQIDKFKTKQEDLLVTGKDLPKDELKYLEQLEAKKKSIDKEEKSEAGIKTKTGDELKGKAEIKAININITKMVGVETIETTKMDSSTINQVGESIEKILEAVVFDSANIAFNQV